jgi:hypothetical protein
VSALIQSFSYVKYAMPLAEESQGVMIKKATDEMFRIKVANQHYQCAASMVEEYTKSINESISLSARAAHQTYMTVVTAGMKAIGEYENLIRVLASGKMGSFDHGSLARRLTDIQLEVDNAWELFVAVTIPAAAHALVHIPERAHERLSRLSITETQRKMLLQDLEQMFGKSVLVRKRQPDETLERLEAAAVVLHTFLSENKGKARDSR